MQDDDDSLCHEHAGSSGLLDLLFGLAGEELGLDDHGLFGEMALSENLVVALKQMEESG